MSIFQIFIILFILLLIVSCCLYPIILKEIAKDDFPRLISKLLFISLALITFIFGIHSETFSSYDKYGINSPTQYNWFSPKDIIKFPIEQYKISAMGIYPENTIDFENGLISSVNLPTRKVTILLDKTASVTYNVSDEKRNSLKKSLIKNLDSSIDDFHNILKNKKLKIEDLYILTALEKLTREEHRDTTHIQVIVYKGSYKESGKNRSDFKMLLDEEYVEFNKKERKSFILKCLTDLIDLNSKKNENVVSGRFTDFYGLAEELKKEKYLGKGAYRNNGLELKYQHTSLFILSDFVHEKDLSNNTFQDIAGAWSGISNLVSQINLISFDTLDNSSGASSIQEIFKKIFNHLYFFEFSKTLNTGLSEDEEINIMFSTVIDGSIVKPLVLYHSWDKQDYRYDYKGQVQIKKAYSDSLIVSFLDRIRPSNYVKPYTYLTIQRKPETSNKKSHSNSKGIKLYEYQKKKLEGSEIENYTISFSVDEVESKNFSLEFTYPNISYTVRHPIVFKPVLSYTSSIYLIVLYFLLMISILQGSIYFLLKIYKIRCKNGPRVILSIALFSLVVLSIWILSCYYYELFIISGDVIVNGVILVSLSCLVLSSVLNAKYLKDSIQKTI
ncbi:hypothetical protein [Psychroserpens algicola]|uniref:Uncharacterized protein n=1 Tax=Psychroserpens algicola TaxID=1719034 RepID=A0ABT0H9R3_9FLAO|nr:hypothetical protein [Psychroserpens algicola]MCK8480912.1 hypothetical protein [Psychroserpens algicola]